MDLDDRPHKLAVIGIAILILLSPALIVAFTVWFLTFTGHLLTNELTPLELLELYVLDLLIVVGAAYGLYRLTLALVTDQLPASLDVLKDTDADESRETSSDLSEHE